MDLKQLSDEDFDQHRQNVAIEAERRKNLEQIPGQIAELKHKYVEGGGDPADLDLVSLEEN